MTLDDTYDLERLAYDALGRVALAAAQLEEPAGYETARYIERWTAGLERVRRLALTAVVLFLASSVFVLVTSALPALERYTIAALGCALAIGAAVAATNHSSRIALIGRLKQRVDLEANRAKALRAELRYVEADLDVDAKHVVH